VNPDDRWKPTRRPQGRSANLTPEQQALAEDLHVRALALRAASEEGLSIREAVALTTKPTERITQTDHASAA
jgi:hypothetical protein